MSTPSPDAEKSPPPPADARAGSSLAVARRALPWLAVALLVGLTVSLLVPVPIGGRVAEAGGNLCHAPTFALVAAVCYLTLRSRTKMKQSTAAIVVWGAMVFFGGASEVAQGYTGRDASLQDAVDDAAGVTAGVAAALALEATTARRRWLAASIALVALVLPEIEPLNELWDCYRARHDFPRLASFESFEELSRWSVQHGRITRVADHATDGRWAMRVDLEGFQQNGGDGKNVEYPGVALEELPPNWTGYNELVFDIDVPPSVRPLELNVKVDDRGQYHDWNDRFERVLKLPAGHNEIRIPLEQLVTSGGRRLDLDRISYLQFYLDKPAGHRTFYLDNVRLEGKR
ncbi:MAG: VanZ family protein [Planctomycetia bacterium]|nr:VanZ family protein [Planctomycetia bacterium]